MRPEERIIKTGLFAARLLVVLMLVQIDLSAQNQVQVRSITQQNTIPTASRPRLDLGNGIGIEFVQIPPGQFRMGEDGNSVEKPVRTVKITKGFQLGKYEVTQEQYLAVVGNNPSNFKGAKRPVERVSWNDVQEFIRKLNRANGYVYRLPTEAEWEYAARAGTTGDFGGTGNLDEMGWYSGNSGGETHPVGEKQPNAWGLYDMHGNVMEWVQDRYGDYYSSRPDPDTDPQGPDRGSNRVVRGGGWGVPARWCRSAFRAWNWPGDRVYYLGFRLLRHPK